MSQPPYPPPGPPGHPPQGHPQQGRPQGPPPGYQQGPPPGYQQGPPPGYQQGPPPGYQQGPPPQGYPQQPPTYQPGGQYAAPHGQFGTEDFDSYDGQRIREQVGRAGQGGPARTGGGSLLTEPVLVVNQRTKLIELNNEYRVFDQHGNPLGTVVEVGQSTAKKVLRFVSELDQFLTHTLEVRENSGQPILRLTRPRKVFKSRLVVESPQGPIGEIVQQNVFGKIRFDMVANGQQVGSLNAENWRAWNFNVQDAGGREVARITKTFEGIARTMFTSADNYVVHIHYQLPEPLRSLVVASALCVDTALKQDQRGFN